MNIAAAPTASRRLWRVFTLIRYRFFLFAGLLAAVSTVLLGVLLPRARPPVG